MYVLFTTLSGVQLCCLRGQTGGTWSVFHKCEHIGIYVNVSICVHVCLFTTPSSVKFCCLTALLNLIDPS